MSAVAFDTKVNKGADISNHPRHDLQLRLQTAFSAFSNISSQLTNSYQELEQRVDELQLELAQTDMARVREHTAREVLAERLDVVINAMPVSVILLDGRGVVAKSNAMADELFGDTVTGQRWLDIIRTHFSPRPADGHEVTLNNGKLVSIATQSLNGEPGQIIVLNDQTETRQLQHKLNHHRKLSEMGKMTASLAHQVRTPLSTAILYADHLSSESLSEERRLRYAAKLKSRLMQLEQQVRDMLIFSRGGVVLDSVLTIEHLTGIFKTRAEDCQNTRRAVIEFGRDVPAGCVRCNSDLLASVFANLIDNAIEACTAMGTTPKVRIESIRAKASFIEFSILDNGPGIPPGHEDKVLEPFYTTKSTGTGLGLAVVKAVIESHGGQFSVGNGAHGGAVASILLPLFQDKPADSVEA
ncbi:sensor histidine kinase [Ketobacter alkanivorans]|nr:PAS domain-containing sensor histidine kinase [Ketobacter alkanivorans]